MDKKKMFILIISVIAIVIIIAVLIGLLLTKKDPFIGTVKDKETNEPVQNVLVTDGRNVVKTDEDGKFELKGWRKSHLITITVPSGYVTDEFFIPVEKTTESYDFTIKKSELTSQENHSFIQISDTEINARGVGEWINDVKDIVKETNPAFLIHTGDICYEDGLKRHIKDMNTDNMGCPVRYIIGNHDFVEGKYGEELYESIYGPTWYSFNVGNTHYVVTPIDTELDNKSGYSKTDCWKWLENDLKNIDENMQIVIFNHTKSLEEDYVYSLGTRKLDLKKHNLIAWVFGHYHHNAVFEKDGVLNISTPRPDSGGIDSSPAGTRIINVAKDGEISTQMKYYDLNKSTEPQNAVWKTKLEGNVLYTDTVIDNGCIYTATIDDDYPKNCGVYCLNAENGTTEWSYKTKNSIKNNIVIQDNKLVAMDLEGRVYCLNKNNGSLLWEKQVAFLSRSIDTSSGICVKDGIVISGNTAYVTALNLENGDIKWEKERRLDECSPAEFVSVGNKILVNSHWGSLVALDFQTGKKLWECKDDDIRHRSSTPLSIDDNTILVTGRSAIMFVDTDKGEIINKTVIEDYTFSSSAQPLCNNGIAYIPTSNKGIVAFDLNTKKIVWNFETSENILFTAPYSGKGAKTIESTPIIDGDNLIFGANDGYIYEINAITGELVKKYFVGSAVMGKVVYSADKLYAGAFNGYVVCYK